MLSDRGEEFLAPICLVCLPVLSDSLLPLPGNLLQAFRLSGWVHMAATDGIGYFGHVYVAAGVHRNAVRRDELAWAFPLFESAESGQEVPVQVKDAHSMPQAGSIINAAHSIEFPNVDIVLPEHHSVWAVDVVPHGDEIASGVEDLNPVGFSVNHVDPIVAVNGNVVGSYELAWVYARTTPGELVLTGPGVYVDARIAVAI